MEETVPLNIIMKSENDRNFKKIKWLELYFKDKLKNQDFSMGFDHWCVVLMESGNRNLLLCLEE